MSTCFTFCVVKLKLILIVSSLLYDLDKVDAVCEIFSSGHIWQKVLQHAQSIQRLFNVDLILIFQLTYTKIYTV